MSSNGVSLHIAEWGELLAFGSNQMTKENVSEDFLASMELRPGRSVTQPDLMETGEIRAEIRNIAEKHKLTQIGGAITSAVIRDNRFESCYEFQRRDMRGVLVEGVFLRDNHYFFIKNGKQVPLVDFYNYPKNLETTGLSL